MNTAPVTTRALVQRINRVLSKDDKLLKACRANSQWYRDLGDYYVVDLDRNKIDDNNVDIEKLGRALGVFKEFERLADE